MEIYLTGFAVRRYEIGHRDKILVVISCVVVFIFPRHNGNRTSVPKDITEKKKKNLDMCLMNSMNTRLYLGVIRLYNYIDRYLKSDKISACVVILQENRCLSQLYRS